MALDATAFLGLGGSHMRVAAAALTISLLSTPVSFAGTCHHSFIAEGTPPAAFEGINLTETSFTSYVWAWGANTSDQGSLAAGLVDDGTGIAVNPGFLWANSDNCAGEITGIGLLVEAQTAAEGGKVALVAAEGSEVHLDALQAGVTQSVAATIPVPQAVYAGSGTDGFGEYFDYTLAWTPPTTAWALSDIPDVLAGYAVYVISASGGGPVNTGHKGGFARVEATPTGSAPYITDDTDTDGLLPASQTSCTVRLRPGETFFFALALIFDGSASSTDPQANPSAVETTVVSACTIPLREDGSLFADGFESGDTSAWSGTVE